MQSSALWCTAVHCGATKCKVVHEGAMPCMAWRRGNAHRTVDLGRDQIHKRKKKSIIVNGDGEYAVESSPSIDGSDERMSVCRAIRIRLRAHFIVSNTD